MTVNSISNFDPKDHIYAIKPNTYRSSGNASAFISEDTRSNGGGIGCGTATSRKVAGSIPDGVIGIFH